MGSFGSKGYKLPDERLKELQEEAKSVFEENHKKALNETFAEHKSVWSPDMGIYIGSDTDHTPFMLIHHGNNSRASDIALTETLKHLGNYKPENHFYILASAYEVNKHKRDAWYNEWLIPARFNVPKGVLG